MDDKVLRQLKRAMKPGNLSKLSSNIPALTDLRVDWSAFKSAQPAPFKMPPLFNGGRMVVYAFLSEV
jgi:hypothetical protein